MQAAIMEELAISGPTTISETGRVGVKQVKPKSNSEEVSQINGDTFSASPTTSGNVSVIHPDEDDDPHPGVLTEDVLECVFKHLINRSSSWKQNRGDKICVLQDVQNIRLVCKTWKNVATLLYRRIQVPTKFSSSDGLKPFLEVMKNSDLIPVQDYKFYYNADMNDTDVELFKDFLLTCGSDIVSLYLGITNYSVDMFYGRGLAVLKLEKLKKLELHLYNCRGDYRMHDSEPFLGLLLNSTLWELKFDSWISPSVLTKQFESIICWGLPTTVKILHLSGILLDEESLATLAATGLKLEELKLDASYFPGKELAIRKFLESQTNTLKTLLILIMGRCISESTEFEFPRLNQLLYVKVNGIRVKPFSFTKTFPKLQTLDIGGWGGSSLVELLSFERFVPSVNKVIMPNSRFAKTISKHFPNITTLRISRDPSGADARKTLQEIFIHFPNLEQLYIRSDVFTADSLLSGVSEAGCKRILREANFDEINLRSEQSMPSMLNLTKLKRLVVTPGFGRFLLTDISAHFVFLQMTNLKELSLSCAKISPRYVELLENKLDLHIEWNCYLHDPNY